ncbi:MAG: flagellar protein FlgN [Phycisphaerales bacterium JB043]
MSRRQRQESIQQSEFSCACEALVEVLESLCEVYARLEELAGARRGAIRSVDHRGLADALEGEQSLTGRLVMLNQRRMDAVRAIEGVIGRPERGETSVRWIVERLEAGERRERLAEVGERLRELIRATKRRTESDRLATEKVCAHVRGILQAASERLNHAGTYGQRGTIDARGGQIVSAMDVTS